LSMCTYFVGDEGCCTNETLVAAENAYLEASISLNSASIITAGLNYTAYFVDEVASVAKSVCKVSPKCSQSALDSAITEGRAQLTDVVRTMLMDARRCVASLDAYAMGMVCFACSPDSHAYLVNASDASAAIRIEEHACDQVFDQCHPLLDDSSRLLSAAVDMTDALAHALGAQLPVPPYLDPRSHVDMCGMVSGQASEAACREFVCGTLLNGFSIPKLSFEPWPAPSLLKAKSAAAHGHNVYSSSLGWQAYTVGVEDVGAIDGGGMALWQVGLVGVGSVAAGALVAAAGMHATRPRRTQGHDLLLHAEGNEGQLDGAGALAYNDFLPAGPPPQPSS
jgi:hypothetical protein